MSDVYIYYFATPDESSSEDVISLRPATLEAIKGRGQPLMESQIVVDHSELGQDGFRLSGMGTDSREMNDIGAEMCSLELRAASRDNEANNSADDIKKYMLSLESRELRKQARALKSRHTEPADSQPAYQTDEKDFIHFGAGLAIE